jgi:hypothetical protein
MGLHVLLLGYLYIFLPFCHMKTNCDGPAKDLVFCKDYANVNILYII